MFKGCGDLLDLRKVDERVPPRGTSYCAPFLPVETFPHLAAFCTKVDRTHVRLLPQNLVVTLVCK